MEKALVCGELSEEESMLQLERNQLSGISTPDQHARNDELIMELQKTIQDRSGRIDALKVSDLNFSIVVLLARMMMYLARLALILSHTNHPYAKKRMI